MAKLLHGVLPALITPFREDGAVAVELVPALVEFHLAAGVSGFYVCGNTGEGFHMTVPERKAMLHAVVSAVHGRVPVVAMVAAHTLEASIELARHAKDVGAQAISSVVPLDAPNNLEAAVAFWRGIGGATDLPLYIYWIAATAATKDAQQFYNAVKTIPHFAGFKFTDTNFYLFQQLMVAGDGAFNGLTGPDEMMIAGLAMGSDGAIGSTYNIYPQMAALLYNSFRSGDIQLAMRTQATMNEVIALLLTVCNCHVRGTNIIAGIKFIYKHVHGMDVGVARPAAATLLTPAQEEALIAGLKRIGLELLV